MKKPRTSSQLRIIGGQWRGRKLAIANVDGLRPTGDRIRETLFNWLAAELPQAHCLDLFAGSGALGFESLSRGAKQVLMLEKHPLANQQLKQHCQTLAADGAEVIAANSIEWLAKPSLNKHSIDIAFIDPPFAEDLWDATINALEDSELLKEGAMIYIETPKALAINTPSSWELYREKQTGQVCYRLFHYCRASS